MVRLVWVAGLCVLALAGAPDKSLASSLLHGERHAAVAPHQASQSHELRRIVRKLTAEARDIADAGLPPDARPDFVERYEGDLAAEIIQTALTERQHREPFVDAYIRWQLLSFEPGFPELDDRAFLRLLSELPVLLPNPRGERSFMNLAGRAEEIGALSPDDFERLQEIDDEAMQAMERAEAMNRPAMALRKWVRDGIGDCDLRTLQSLIEECAVTIDGAWPTRAVKTALTLRFTEAADRLTDEQKRILAEQARGLIGRERRYVNSITYFANHAVNVSYSRPRVSQRDYDRWMQRLAGEQ